MYVHFEISPVNFPIGSKAVLLIPSRFKARDASTPAYDMPVRFLNSNQAIKNKHYDVTKINMAALNNEGFIIYQDSKS